MTLYRYIYLEIMKPFVFMTIVLLLLLIATEVSDTLTKVLTRQFSDNAIWVVLGLQIPILMAEIIPAAYFLACLTTLHRISQDSERAIFQAIGISDSELLTFLILSTAIPIMILVLALNHYVTPNAQKQLELFVTEQKNRPITDVIDASSFYNINQLGMTFYATNKDSSEQKLNDVIAIENKGSAYTVITAKTAKTANTETGQQFAFEDGQQSNFTLGSSSESVRQTFETLTINIEKTSNAKPWQRRNAVSTKELMNSKKRADRSTVIDRFNTSLYIPLFCIWAVALTRFKPRNARVGALAFGITFYVLTSFSYRTLNGAISKSDLTLLISPWWFFGILCIVGYGYVRRIQL